MLTVFNGIVGLRYPDLLRLAPHRLSRRLVAWLLRLPLKGGVIGARDNYKRTTTGGCSYTVRRHWRCRGRPVCRPLTCG